MAFRSRKNKKDLCKPQPQLSRNTQETAPVNSRNKVVVASLIGTAIEFFASTSMPPPRSSSSRISFSRRAMPLRPPCSRWPPSPSPSSPGRSAPRCLATSAIASPEGHPRGLAVNHGDLHRGDLACCPAMKSLALSRRCCWRWRASVRALASAGMGGAALLATERPGAQSAPCTAPSRSWARRSASLRQRHLPAALLAADRPAVYGVGLARAVYLLCGAGDYRSVCSRLAA